MKKVILKPGVLEKSPTPVTLNEYGIPVCLTGEDLTREVPGDGTNPPVKRVVKGATAADLKWLLANGNPLLIEIEVEDKKA